MAVRTGLIKNRQLVRGFILFIMAVCLLMRLWLVNSGPISLEHNYFPTHLRADALFFGVLLADLFYYDKEKLFKFFQKYFIVLMLIAVVCLLPIFLFPRKHIFMASFGISLLYLGFGILLIAFVSRAKLSQSPFIIQKLSSAVAWIGIYSYSIYLWHMFVASFLMSFITNTIAGNAMPAIISFILYLVISVVTGVIFAKLIEIPALKLRDKIFPSTT